MRKDTFKKAIAETTVWRRRVELREKESDILQDASSTYFDWLTTLRGEEISRDQLQYEEKLLNRARKLAKDEKPVQVVVKAIETAIQGRHQYLLHTHQQSKALAAKLMYLMGMNGGALLSLRDAGTDQTHQYVCPDGDAGSPGSGKWAGRS